MVAMFIRTTPQPSDQNWMGEAEGKGTEENDSCTWDVSG